jgi:hypothetical protein
MKPTNIKELQARSRRLSVHGIDGRTFIVDSGSNAVSSHVVTVHFDADGMNIHARCTCNWAVHKGVACTHVMAVLESLAALKGRTLSFWLTREDAVRQKHRTFFLTGANPNDGVWITSRNSIEAAERGNFDQSALRRALRRLPVGARRPNSTVPTPTPA